MKLKTDASGNAVLQDGKPVYVAEDGKELALDAADLYGQVKRLTGENRDHRKAKEDAETKLAQYADIDDPKAAREALETVKSLEGTGASGETFYQLDALNESGQPVRYKTHSGSVTHTYSYYANSKRLQNTKVSKPGGG